MTDFPLDKAEMLAIFLETFLYGIFFTLFCITLYVLLRRTGHMNRSLVAILIIMILLATGHIVLDFVRIMEAFITRRDTTEGGTLGYYLDLSNPLHSAKTALYVAQTLTGDSLALWRCFVIRGRSWFAIIIPMLLLLSNFVTGCTGTYFLSTAKPGMTVFETARAWITCFFVLTLCQNLYCTGSIVFRIWTANNTTATYYRQYTLFPVLLIVVESGALYSTALIALLTTYLSGTNGQYPVLDCVQQIVGIAFSLIIIQISAVVSRSSACETSDRWKANVQRSMHPSVHTFPLQPASVEITQMTHSDFDGIYPALPASADESKTVEVWHVV